MKILFLLRHGLYLRNFEAPIRELARRGHRVHLGFSVEPHHEHLDVDALARNLAAEHPGVSHGFAPERSDLWVGLLRDSRSARNLLQYYEPRFEAASKLRKRVWRSASDAAQRFVRFPGVRGRRARRWAHALLRGVEHAAPADATALAYLRQQSPEVLFVSPYVDTKFDQVDFVKAARALGIPTVYGVASWDNLTTKGTIQVPPDRMLVWNEAQASEAVEIHGFPRERIDVTGAQLYDQWFDRLPSRPRGAFCALHGFDADRPLVLFVGSSGFIAEEELPFVTRWLTAIRESSDVLVREANILVRPHPTNAKSWAEADLESFGRVAVWPRQGAVPMTAESKSDYFDTLYHASAIVGINTSALVEAGIVGKRPLTVLDPAFALTQQGTLHFAHLTEGGYLAAAQTLDEHLAHLSGELRRGPQRAPEADSFVRRFLRPYGADAAATPRFVAAIERAAAQGGAPRTRSLGQRALGAALTPLAALRRRHVVIRTQEDRRQRIERRRRGTLPYEAEAARLAAQGEPEPLTAERYCTAGGMAEAVDRARQSPAWHNYCRARDYVRRLLRIPTDAPSAYWREELAGFEYLLDASPLVVSRLRQHAYHITGLRAHDFAPDDKDGRRSLGEKLAALRKLDRRELLVPESRALGGFGYDLRGALYNVDTLKFYECLLTLDDAGLLPTDDDPRRRVVLEIGAGWGGFAYQFLTRFPGRATYVIVDLPPTLLFSATYLPTMFPAARVAYVDAENLEATLADWARYDLIFLPAACWSRVRKLPIELAINMVSFQEMTSRQVDQYAALLADLGCSTLYSLNRERSPHNCELTAVSAILGQYYDLRPLQLVDQQYTQWKAEKRKRKPRDPAKDGSYQHLVGTLKPAAPAPVWMSESPRGRAARGRHRAKPRIGLAMPAYNETHHLCQALESLQAQTRTDFRLVVVDDSTSPEPGEIVRRYAAGDRRIEYRRNPVRQGMVGNWRAGFAAFEPGLDYFAWVSDHDLWHPQWLEKLAATLDEFPEVSLVYPAAARMDAGGRRVLSPPHAFDTFGLSRPQRFARLAGEGRSFGNMVYGLYRADRLRKAGVFRRVLLPDVLLLWELSLDGTIKQIHEELWYRRYVHRASLERQRATLFAPAPWHAHLPWPLTHWALLTWRRALAPGAGSLAERAFIGRMVAGHAKRFWRDLLGARDEDGAAATQHKILGSEPIELPSAVEAMEADTRLAGPHWDASLRNAAARAADTP